MINGLLNEYVYVFRMMEVLPCMVNDDLYDVLYT